MDSVKSRRNLFELLSLMIIILSILGKCRGHIELQNHCKIPIVLCSNGASRPITLQPDEATPLEEPYDSSLVIWPCRSSDRECINTQNPIATVAELNVGNDSISYRLSAENGFNFAIRIMSLGVTSCPTITCIAKLDDCPDELQILDSSGAVVACKPPDCFESAQLCSMYSSLVGDSCQTPGSSYDPSSISSTCPASIDLLVSFISNYEHN